MTQEVYIILKLFFIIPSFRGLSFYKTLHTSLLQLFHCLKPFLTYLLSSSFLNIIPNKPSSEWSRSLFTQMKVAAAARSKVL